MSLVGMVRLLHVVSAVFWAGTIFFFVLFLEPVLRSLGPDGGRVVQALQARRFFAVMITNATVTLLTGVFVFWQLTDGFAAEAMRSPYAHSLLTGALLGVVTLGTGVFVSQPTTRRLALKAQAIAASGGPPTEADRAELDRLRTRLRRAGRAAAAMLLLAVIAMASARYV